MELQTRLRLSFYKEIAEIDTAHNIRLVQHTVTGKIFVKKALSIYDLQVFQYLMTQKIPGTPKIEELIEENTTLYVIEEYISGNSLEEILAKRKSSRLYSAHLPDFTAAAPAASSHDSS